MFNENPHSAFSCQDDQPVGIDIIENTYKFIYGPLHSWRLGISLGIDPLSQKHKICNLNCLYCQLGKTRDFTDERKDYVSVDELVLEIKSLPVFPYPVDYITFSGKGEPTLAKNLGEMINALRRIRPEKIAVITNSALLHRSDVCRDLARADYVLAKLDACCQESFQRVDLPSGNVHHTEVLKGIKNFKAHFKGKLALQIMFIDTNRAFAQDIARIARGINPDEVFLNTPLRPCAVRPLSKEELLTLKNYFQGMPVATAYESGLKYVSPLSEHDTFKRRSPSTQSA